MSPPSEHRGVGTWISHRDTGGSTGSTGTGGETGARGDAEYASDDTPSDDNTEAGSEYSTEEEGENISEVNCANTIEEEVVTPGRHFLDSELVSSVSDTCNVWRQDQDGNTFEEDKNSQDNDENETDKSFVPTSKLDDSSLVRNGDIEAFPEEKKEEIVTEALSTKRQHHDENEKNYGPYVQMGDSSMIININIEAFKEEEIEERSETGIPIKDQIVTEALSTNTQDHDEKSSKEDKDSEDYDEETFNETNKSYGQLDDSTIVRDSNIEAIKEEEDGKFNKDQDRTGQSNIDANGNMHLENISFMKVKLTTEECKHHNFK